jgi:hypothetical protein
MAMMEREHNTSEKLPHTRKYLRAARSGLDAILDQKPIGPDYLFQMNGLLATLRACQHVLFKRDRKLSPRHEEVIGVWWKKDFKQVPELCFITDARNLLLKEGSFPSYATRSQASWETDVVDYEMAHYLGGERRDFETDVRAAFDWFERQLAEIEAELPSPPGDEDNEPSENDSYTLPAITPETIAGTMTTPAIEDGAMIAFKRRPQPWRHGDVIEIFRTPFGRATLTAIEHLGFVWWESETQRFQLERIDDHHYRIVLKAQP